VDLLQMALREEVLLNYRVPTLLLSVNIENSNLVSISQHTHNLLTLIRTLAKDHPGFKCGYYDCLQLNQRKLERDSKTIMEENSQVMKVTVAAAVEVLARVFQ
jgi:hypothetical protein